MVRLNINPTRQELLKLKIKLKTAKRGHKLLKEKRDGLMKEFMGKIREAKRLREETEKDLSRAFRDFTLATAEMGKEVTEEALCYPQKKVSLKAKTKNVMSVMIPEFSVKEEGDFLSYSLATTSSVLDNSLKTFSNIIKDLITLAQLEHSCGLLAVEIEKTRRRVNALEYVFIPQIQETIRYITAKLNEQERGTIVTLMKVKDIIEKQQTV